MATEEIEISELEFTKELASDNLIPVESSTDTKATSLQILKNWLSSFFVGKTGDEAIEGYKTFKDGLLSNKIITSDVETINYVAKNNNIDINTTPSNLIYTGYDFRGKDNIRLAYLGVVQSNTNGERIVQFKMLNGTVGADMPRAKDPATKKRTATDFKPATLIYNYREGTQWCRLWSDGWLEQGGHLGGATNVNTLTFLRPFKDNQYTFIRDVFIYGPASGSPVWNEFTYTNKATTGVQLYKTNAIIQIDWYACGYER